MAHQRTNKKIDGRVRQQRDTKRIGGKVGQRRDIKRNDVKVGQQRDIRRNDGKVGQQRDIKKIDENVKQQRDINKIDKTILDNFYKLVHSQPNIRLTAASSTFKILETMKKTRTDKFNENLNYTVDRLVAGLSSSRALARRGYGTLLLEILRSYQVSTDRLYTIAQQKFGHISKDTSRDNLIGYFLLISIILESENYKRSKVNSQCIEKLYKCLIQLHRIKSYLDYSVSQLLVTYHKIFHSCMIAELPANAFESDSKVSALELLIIALCNRVEPIKQLLSMDSSSLTNLCCVLSDEKFQKRPLHPAFIEVSKMIVEHFPNQFKNFYTSILFPTFFKKNHNELASIGLDFTAELVSSIEDSSAIKILLNEHVIRILITSLRSRNSLHKHCIKFFTTLKEHFKDLQSNSEEASAEIKQFNILNILTNPPGSTAFDEDSKSSSITDLLQNSDKNSLKKHMLKLMTSLDKKSGKEDRHHQACIRQVAYIIRRPQLIDDQITLTKVAKFLLLNSMFRMTTESVSGENKFWELHAIPKPSMIINESTRATIKSAYHTTLEHIIAASDSTQRLEQLSELINFSDQLFELDGFEYVFEDGSEESSRALKANWEVFKNHLSAHRKLVKKQKDSKQLYPITSLYLFYGLQVVEHQLECNSQLEELAQSAEESIKADSADGSWADILCDQIIAILSATECSSWIRRLCESVFGSLLPHISQTSIDLLCDAVKAPLAHEGDDCSDEEMDDDDDDDEGDITNEADSEGNSVHEADSEISSFAGDDDMEKSQDEDDSMLLDEGSSSKDQQEDQEDEEEEEYLDDETMMKMDTVIADMFKLKRLNKKKEDPGFKLRCLDLIRKIVMKKHNDVETIETILATIIPLANSSRKSNDTRPISEKVVSILTKMPGKSKYPKMVEFLERQKGKSASKKTKKNKKKERMEGDLETA